MQRKYRFLWLALIIPLGAVGAFATGLVPVPWQPSEETSKIVAKPPAASAEAEKPVKQAAVQSPAKQSAPAAATKPADKAAKPKLPFGIDVARLNGDGSSVIAGYGKPGKAMTVMADGKPVGVVTPDPQGDWVLITAYKFAHLDPKLSLKFGNHIRKTVAALNTTQPSSKPQVRSDAAPPKPAAAAQPQQTETTAPRRRAAEVTEQMLSHLKKLTAEAEAKARPTVTGQARTGTAATASSKPSKSSQQVASNNQTPPQTKPTEPAAAVAKQPVTAPGATAKVAALTKRPAAPTQREESAKASAETVKAPVATPPASDTDKPAAAAPDATDTASAVAPRETVKAPVAKPKASDKPAATAPSATAKASAEAPHETEKVPVATPKVSEKPAPVAPSATAKASAEAARETVKAPVATPQVPEKPAAAAPSATAKAPAATPAPTTAAAGLAKAAAAEKSAAAEQVASATPAAATTPREDAKSAVANLPVPVQFVYRKAELTPKGREAAALLLKYFLAKDFKAVVLSGHADERGTNRANMALSKQRLLRIEQLLREGGFQGRLKLVPKGETEKYTGVDRSQFDTEELWQLDRRVEVVSAS